MPQRGTITINDRESTPVAHAFTPDGEDKNNVHIFTEKTGVPLSNPRLTVSVSRTGNGQAGKYKPTLRLQVPITQTQTINGVSQPVIVRTAYVELSATFDGLSTEQERKNAIGLMANAMAASQSILNPVLTQLEDLW